MRSILPALLSVLAATVPACARERTVQWPSFRGPQASGVALGSAPPTRWNAETGDNVRWSTPIPGLAHSSPVIWGDRIFVTTATSAEENPKLVVGLYGDIDPVEEDAVQHFKVYCLDKRTGAILWERTAYEGAPRVKRHTKSSHANPTPATDGKHVVAFFGSAGLYAYDMRGELLWKKDLGLLDSGYYQVPTAQWGFGSSPVIHRGAVIVQCDVQSGGGFLAAFDVADGHELWRTPREEVPTWSTPTVRESDSRTEVVVNGYHRIGGYDFRTGKALWWLKGGGDIPVPTPVVSGDLIFITNAHGGLAPLWAIRSGAEGDISLKEGETANTHVAWSYPRSGSYMQTPLVYADHVYVCKDNGVLTAFEARTGRQVYQERLGGGSAGFTASGVAADGKLYYTSELGEVYVVRAGPKFELLAQNPMREICMATPAISEDALYFRTRHQLVAVAAPRER